MNATIIDHETFAQTITEQVQILAVLEGPGNGQTFICTHEGVDILIIADTITGGAIVIHPCSEDHDAGGSLHGHARAG